MFSPRVARALMRTLGTPEQRDRRSRASFDDAGHGYDAFGLHPDMVGLGDLITSPVYRRWFRVRSYGVEHLPRKGAAILAANHSGTLPYDAAMLWADVYRNTNPPRAPRPIADYFVSSLPLVSTLFARSGTVGGSRGNARALLQAGEMLMLFPEGTEGIGKPFADRYELQRWSQGHCELAIRHQAPVIPVAIIGAEEQMPQIARLPGVAAVPYIPIPATLVPLPVRYHIHYGTPIDLHRRFSPEDADDPEIVAAAALEVKAAVQDLVHDGLAMREGVFR